jgi:hypothetical protein
MDGSNSWSISSAIVPSHASREANLRGSVVSMFIHHVGCVAVSAMVRRVRAGGIENPLRLSRSRGPATGTSTVSISAS